VCRSVSIYEMDLGCITQEGGFIFYRRILVSKGSDEDDSYTRAVFLFFYLPSSCMLCEIDN